MTIPGNASVQESLRFRPPYHQTSVPVEKLINSATAGFLIHRVGQLRSEFRDEARAFSADLVELINTAQAGYATILAFEELFGAEDRLHWLLHLKQPNDYQRLLHMVDHSQKWQEVSHGDRLPAKGGGNWERMFLEGSLTETIICPQHGLTRHDGGHSAGTFQPPAMYQSTLAPDQLLNSVIAPFTVHRRIQVRYAYREEARRFWFAWAELVTETMAGRATAFLFEEMWGQQDRLHLLIHLASPDAYADLPVPDDDDPALRDILTQLGAARSSASPAWHQTAVDGTLTDTLWAPLDGHRS
jgi:hypothetical protein